MSIVIAERFGVNNAVRSDLLFEDFPAPPLGSCDAVSILKFYVCLCRILID